MSVLIENVINRDNKLKNLYQDRLTPSNINDIITLIADFKFSQNNPDLNPQEIIYHILKSKMNNLSQNEKDDLIQLLIQKSSEVKESTDSINILTRKNRELPFYQSIKLRFPKLIELFLENGYIPDNKEKQFILEKGLYGQLNPALFSNIQDIPDSNSVFLSLLKELNKFQQGLFNRNLNIIDDIFNFSKKEEVLQLLEKERNKDLLVPYFYDTYYDKNQESSVIIKCIIENDLNGIYSLLKNNFILNLKEYSLMYSSLLIDEKDFKKESNFPDFYKNREFIIQKLNTYPKEYKKELSLNIMNKINLNWNNDPDILFSLKDIIFDSFSDFNEREKFQFVKLKNTLIAPVFVAMLSKEDQKFFLNIFGGQEVDFPRVFLNRIYPLTKKTSLYKEKYSELFYDKLKSFSLEERQHVVNILNSGKLNTNKSENQIQDYLELSSIIEKGILKENVMKNDKHNNKDKIKRL